MDQAVAIDHSGGTDAERTRVRSQWCERSHHLRDVVDDPVQGLRRRCLPLLDDGAVRIDQRDPHIGATEIHPECRHRHGLLVSPLLAHHTIGRVDERLGCVEQRVGRLEDVIADLGHGTEQLGDDALEDRRCRE